MAPPSHSFDDLHRSLIEVYGPLLSDALLWRALGFKTWAGFDKAVRRGKVGVRVLTLPGRRGRYALTRDVASWLWEVRATEAEPRPPQGETIQDEK